MNHTPRVTVITTTAQHRHGAQIHIRNLNWALSGLNVKILLQTFSEYNFQFQDVTLIESPHPAKKFYHFWDHITPHLKSALEDTDVFLFTEQDIFFTDQILDQAINCAKHQKIILNLQSDYLALFSAAHAFKYPRIWEGATFLPVALVRKALTDGISFGSTPSGNINNHSKSSWDKLLNQIFVCQGRLDQEFLSIQDYLSRKATDTLFEFSVYCYLNRVAYSSNSENYAEYEWGKNVVHFRFLDMLCHNCPDLYQSPDKLLSPDLSHAIRSHTPEYVAMMILLNIYECNRESASLLIFHQDSHSRLRALDKVLRIQSKAAQWLQADEIERLNWVAQVLSREQIWL